MANTATKIAPGLAVTGLVALAALGVDTFERRLIGQPVVEGLVAAILIGMLVRNVVALPAAVDAGASYAAKQVLEFGVLLLGATIDARQVLAAGPLVLVAIAVGVTCSIGISYSIGRTLGLHGRLALLVAVGNSICGNSAIAAIAPVIRAEKKDVASSIALTAIIGVVLVLSLPLLVPLAGLTFYQYGVVAGMTVYAVPQVIAASFPVSQLSGQVATFVKLLRVLLLGPVVLVASLAVRARGQSGQAAPGAKRPALVPWFIAGFLILGTLRFLGFVPAPAVGLAQESSRLITVLAMAGLGLGVEFGALRKAGPRVAAAVLASLAFLLTFSLLLVRVMHIGV
ncbi:MAG: YeiH family protein [Chloroflexota bacterium]